MARNDAALAMESLNLSDPDSDTENLFASPSRTEKKPAETKALAPTNPIIPGKASRELPNDPTPDSEEVREAGLRRELASIRSINEVIEGVVDSLERAKGNMDVRFSYSSVTT